MPKHRSRDCTLYIEDGNNSLKKAGQGMESNADAAGSESLRQG